MLDISHEPGRTDCNDAHANLRPYAGASASLSMPAPSPALPLQATVMERHALCSQTFVPIDADQYLVLVAPHHPDGGPPTWRGPARLIADGLGAVALR